MPGNVPLYPPVATIDPYGGSDVTVLRPAESAGQLAAADIPAALRAAALRLSASLTRRVTDADVWHTYLAPDRIVEAIDQKASPQSLSDLVRNYDGVTANSSLRWLIRADGFEPTRRLLRQWIESSAAEQAERDPVDEPEPEASAPEASAPPPPAAAP